MADTATITPEAARAIMLHLQGGGDPAHSMAVASGAITPELAQQLALQSGDSSKMLSLPEMHGLLMQPTAQAPLGAPQLQADPSLASLDAAPSMAPDAAPPAPPAPQLASSMPPVSEKQRADGIVDNMASSGAELGQKADALNMATVAQQGIAAKAGLEAAAGSQKYAKGVAERSKEVLQKSNDEITSIDQREADALQQRQDTMDKILGNMLNNANDAAQVAPHDFWYNKSTSSKIFAVISQIAGGAANGLANQPGQPTAIDRIIENDLNEQRLAFAQKSQESNQNSGIYNDLVKASESQTAAYGALRIAAYKRVEAQLKQAAVDDPTLLSNKTYLDLVAKTHSDRAAALGAVAKEVGAQAIDTSKAAATDATSLANTEIKGKADVDAARIDAAAKVQSAKEAGAAGKQPFHPTGVYVLPGHEVQAQQGVPDSFQQTVYNTTTGYSSLQREIEDINGIWKGPFDNAVKVKMIGEHQQAVARDLSKIYNAGNRVAGGAYDEMTGGIPPTIAAKLGKFLSEKLFFDDATLKSLIETQASSENYANNALAPFGYTVTAPKVKQ